VGTKGGFITAELCISMEMATGEPTVMEPKMMMQTDNGMCRMMMFCVFDYMMLHQNKRIQDQKASFPCAISIRMARHTQFKTQFIKG
jgi:hypothetical protein